MPRRRTPRQPNPLKSIHDPADPSPSVLPAPARREWDEAYEEALDAYQGKDLARRAAWRTVDLRWRQTGRQTWQRCKNGLCQPWPQPMMLPLPKTDLVPLGVLVEYSFIDKPGELNIRETDPKQPPILWWDDERKALYAFPRQQYPRAIMPIPKDMDAAVEVYRRWHQRDPQGMVKIPFPRVRVQAFGAADTVSYRSDKWHSAEPDPRVQSAQEYIHNHWYDVWAWQDTDREGAVPNAIMIDGGELELHERGLIH